jgi:hypothetical protein
MKNPVGCLLLVVAGLLGLVGAWTSQVLAPWAFVGNAPPDYGFAVLCYSPLAIAATLLVVGIFVSLRPPGPARLAPAGQIRCGKCAAFNDAHAKFCNQCGTAM